MTFSREDRRTKLTVRIDDELDERLDSYVENGGADNRSAFVRELLDEALPDDDVPIHQPDDPALAEAYRALAKKDDVRSLSIDAAKDVICEESHPQKPKALVREDVLEPLVESGFVKVQYGRIHVYPLTRLDEVDGGQRAAPADD
jgi:Arc/MetJ-type ribon-helix-helix transcriptional regulator